MSKFSIYTGLKTRKRFSSKMRVSRNKFEAWLEAKRPREVVGYARDSTRCPLATFTGVPTDDWNTLSRWCREFIDAVDNALRVGTPVEAWRAIKILAGIKR